MIAVDTNIIVRYLTGDDPDQQAKVLALFEDQRLFVPVTVLLEAEWVLRKAYGFGSGAIMTRFKALAGIRTVTIQCRQDVLRGIAWCADGLDFADALHLALSHDASRLLTFDRAFVKKSRGLSEVDVSEL